MCGHGACGASLVVLKAPTHEACELQTAVYEQRWHDEAVADMGDGCVGPRTVERSTQARRIGARLRLRPRVAADRCPGYRTVLAAFGRLLRLYNQTSVRPASELRNA